MRGAGAKNSNWTGDAASYKARHQRVHKIRGRADRCIHRNAIGCTSQRFEWAQIHRTTGLDSFDYVAMCSWCHHQYDQAGIPRNRGSENGRAVLNEGLVRLCRGRHEAGEPERALAREIGVPASTMRSAIKGTSWGWLA